MSQLLWLDLETTGLDVHGCSILEIGAIITDKHFNEIATFHTVIHRGEAELRVMDDYVRRMHTDSGLLKEVRNSTVTEGAAEQDFKNFIVENFPDSKPILAGSSIHFDKKFIDEQMETVSRKLHYRLVDVSTLKETMRIIFGVELPATKTANHRAMDDIRGSIAEYRRYLEYIKVPAPEKEAV